ncbi:MAG: lipoprotein-releasing system transmembrane subunit LolC [Cellvibrionaceae bacterium]|nr:lipoprotein-releasing system transmembrane subunit LolC [Cellvibrionaceae bacterium]|tara:strand:+ start:12415 stop:13671 length:1257 start_codon:yes stop_codon:yes gene_type:complete
MKLPLSAYIGLRYTRAKRRNQFISFVSGFSLLGMALGTLALIVVMSVMNGFDREIKQRLLQVIPHIEIYSDDGLSDWSDLRRQIEADRQVIAAAPYINGDAMISFERGVQGVQLRGLMPADVARISALDKHMLLGELSELRAGQYNIVIGRLMARYLNVTLGDKISVTLPQLSVTPMGIFPRVKRFTVVGVFEVGAQVDQSLAILHLRDAQTLFRLGQKVTGIEVKTADMYRADAIAAQLSDQLSQSAIESQLVIRDWSESQASLFSAVKMEKTVVSALLMIIIAVAAFNIISSLVLMVADKRFDIAVLRTLGLTRAQVMWVFVVQGTSIGFIGVLIGGMLGSLIAYYVGDIVASIEAITGLRVFDPNVYFISHMPSVLMLSDVLIVVAAGLTMSLLSTLYPAYRASCVEPAEALRYE